MNKIIFLTFCLLFLSCQKDEKRTLTFRDSKIEYMNYGSGQDESDPNNFILNQWLLESAKRKFALCLSNEYLKNPDAEIKNKILEIYNTEEQYFEKDYSALRSHLTSFGANNSRSAKPHDFAFFLKAVKSCKYDKSLPTFSESILKKYCSKSHKKCCKITNQWFCYFLFYI